MDVPDLRPASFGELLDRTFTYYRRHFWLFVAIMAIPQVLIVTINIAWEGIQRTAFHNALTAPPAMRGAAIFGTAFLGILVVAAAFMAIYSIALGATTFAVSEIHLGHATTARAAYQRMRGRFWRLIGLIFVVMIRVYLFLILIMVAAIVLLSLGFITAKSIGAIGGALIILLALTLFLAGTVFWVRFALGHCCAIPAQLLENLKVGAAIKRSITLTRSNLGRVFLLILLMTLVTYTVAAVLGGPFLIASLITSVKTHAQAPFWLVLCTNIMSGVGQTVTGPLLMIGLVLLYYDLRVRKEGFDLQVMMSALDAQAPLPGTPTNSPPPAPAGMQLEQSSVAALVGLTILTLGLYYPIWFMRRRAGINSLKSKEKLNLGIFLLAFALWFLDLVLDLGKVYLPSSFARAGIASVGGLSILVSLAAVVILLIQAFKVRRMIEEHAAESVAGPFANSIFLAQGLSISGVATFFFGIFYLQYKINEMVETWMQSQPGMGPDVVPVV